MINPDLVVILNGRAFIVKGTEYESRDQAVTLAISKIRVKISEDIKLLTEPEPKDRFEDWEEVAEKLAGQKEIKTIEVYEL